MKTIQSGFSLIEFLVYFFLIIQLTVLVTGYMLSSYTTIIGYNKISDIDINLSCAIDVLERDIKQFFSCHGELHTVGEAYIWAGGFDIGWEVKGDSLIRSEGYYNFDIHQWFEVVRGVIVNNIKTLSIEPYYEDGVMRSVCCTVQSSNLDGMLRRVIAIRNRKL